MDAVHWWALVGLIGFAGGARLLSLAIDRDNEAAAKIDQHTKQLRLVREATALMRYGARDEANETLERAIALGDKS